MKVGPVRIWERETFLGCEARGDGDSAFLTRLTLVKCRWFQVMLHWFHRSDADDLHDHPWRFVSLVLWRGYIEVTPHGRRRKWPGMLLSRPALWAHRVELVGGRPALTLVVTGPRVREWGFLTARGWRWWRRYFRDMGC